jgi:hypothetical protein
MIINTMRLCISFKRIFRIYRFILAEFVELISNEFIGYNLFFFFHALGCSLFSKHIAVSGEIECNCPNYYKRMKRCTNVQSHIGKLYLFNKYKLSYFINETDSRHYLPTAHRKRHPYFVRLIVLVQPMSHTSCHIAIRV